MTINPLAFKMDSSKLLDYMRCPRRFFFTHVCGWVSERFNGDLSFGKLWHWVLEKLHTDWDVEAGCQRLVEGFAQMGECAGDTEFDPRAAKGLINAQAALKMYADSGYGRDWKVLDTEVPGSFDFAGQKYWINCDLIVAKPDGRVYVVDHKTAGRKSERWEQQWLISVQMGAYCYAAEQVFGERFGGAEVSTMFFYKPTEDKKTKALTFKNEHVATSIGWGERERTAWKRQVAPWLERLEIDRDRLLGGSGGTSFPQNAPTGCYSYMRPCPYLDMCVSHAPTSELWVPGNPPLGFQEAWWDAERRELVKVESDSEQEPLYSGEEAPW